MFRRCLAAFFCLTLALASPAVADPSCTVLSDSFNGPKLDTDKWSTIQLLPGRSRFAAISANEREGAFAIEIGPDDRGCSPDCQRNEIRESSRYRTTFGEECWYAFRFRIDGEVPYYGSSRWVIGQWKQQN